MYLLVTQIPIYVQQGRLFLDQGWFPDVVLARDWLAPAFGRLTLLAPWVPLEGDPAGFQEAAPSLGVRLVPVFDGRCRAWEFWSREAARWIRAVRAELGRATVLHTTMDDLLRPVGQLALEEGSRAGVPTVLVGLDRDLHEVWSDRLRTGSLMRRLETALYLRTFDWALGRHLRRADLALLKEGAVYDRYAGLASHPRAFCHTMYSVADVVGAKTLERRLSRLAAGAPLRLVYCGRLIHIKGLHVAVEVVEYLRRVGVDVEFDIIGTGPEEETLQRRIGEGGLSRSVRLCGQMTYGPALLRRLAEYDALLYTPLEEDTPRMLYDGYAAGLPFIGASIPFVRHRADADRAGVVFPVNDVKEASRALALLHRERGRLAELSRWARAAGLEHAVESWYGRRAAWTLEAVERKRGAPLAAKPSTDQPARGLTGRSPATTRPSVPERIEGGGP